MGKVLVIVPTYNERDNIERLCRDVLSQGEGVEVLVVDDSSPDGTADIVASLSGRQPRVHLLRRAGKLGLGTAYMAGFQWALGKDYALMVQMDADFSHPPQAIPALVEACGEHHVALGSRYVPGGGSEGWPWRRRVLSRASSWVARTLLRLEPRDCTGGFRCFRREVLEAIPFENIRARGFAFQEEMLWQCSGRGWRIREVPIHFGDRAAGRSKISLREVLAAVLTVVRLMFTPRSRRREDK